MTQRAMEISNRVSRTASNDGLEEGQASIMEESNLGTQKEEHKRLLPDEDGSTPETPSTTDSSKSKKPSVVSKMGLFVLILLAAQNSSKNLLMRYVMKDQPKFLTSAAVFSSECLKLFSSVCYILFYEKKSFQSILHYLHEDRRNTLLLAVPASAYNFQMSMEYVALANLNAAVFSVLVQSKLIFTASFAVVFLRKKLRYIQVISLVILTAGVMLCNLDKMVTSSKGEDDDEDNSAFWDAKTVKGITATLCIAVSSGFASVYTEKVIKGQGTVKRTVQDKDFGLAYTQVQLALMSILAIAVYALFADIQTILIYGLFHNFTPAAFLSVASSACGGLIVASVLKYADSVLKGYATAMSVILTGVLSMVLFGTQLSAIYFMGIINVVAAVLLYNGQNLDQYACS